MISLPSKGIDSARLLPRRGDGRWNSRGKRFVGGIGVRSEGGESDHERSASPEEVGDGLDQGREGRERVESAELEPKEGSGDSRSRLQSF